MSTETVKILNPEEVRAAQAQGDKIAASANNTVFDKAYEAYSTNVEVGYYPGVGSTGTEPGSFIFPSVKSIATAKQAYDDFADAASKWKKDIPRTAGDGAGAKRQRLGAVGGRNLRPSRGRDLLSRPSPDKRYRPGRRCSPP